MDTSKEYATMYDRASEIHAICEVYRDDFYMIKTPSKFQWVPRQEHLQDMIFNRCLAQSMIPLHFVQSFSRWLSQKYEDNHAYGLTFNTMEKSWFAYVMEVYYNKQWNGKEWV